MPSSGFIVLLPEAQLNSKTLSKGKASGYHGQSSALSSFSSVTETKVQEAYWCENAMPAMPEQNSKSSLKVTNGPKWIWSRLPGFSVRLCTVSFLIQCRQCDRAAEALSGAALINALPSRPEKSKSPNTLGSSQTTHGEQRLHFAHYI